MLFKQSPFQKAVEIEQLRLLSEAEALGTDDPGYKTKIEYINSLNTTKSTKDNNVIIAALISAGASVLSIFAVLHYEETGAVVSKAFGMVRKP